MFKRTEKDTNNWTGFESRVILIDNNKHMKLVIETLNNRAVKVKGSYMNVDTATWDERNREIEFFQYEDSSTLKSINKFRVSKEAKYIYIREDILLEGFGHDEDGIPEEANIVGIKINVLTSRSNDYLVEEVLEEEWIDREEKEVFTAFKYLPLAIEEL